MSGNYSDEELKDLRQVVTTVHVPVLNSLLYIRDADIVRLPEIDGMASFWFTDACIAISCQPDCDGATQITIDAIGDIKPDGILLVDRRIKTPSRKVIVEGVLASAILESVVPNEDTRVCIWTDGSRGTAKVIIGLI